MKGRIAVLIYSVIPIDIIMQKNDETSENATYVELEYMGEKIQAVPLQNNEYKINRLISTSPRAYLNPALQPGVIIRVRF